MATNTDMYIANLAFFLDYDQGTTADEIEYEIFKIAFQDKESIHYDRSIGGNFMDLEQDPANITSGLLFSSNLIQSIYTMNREKNNVPFVIMGHNDINIVDKTSKDEEYLVEISYRLLEDVKNQGMVKI